MKQLEPVLADAGELSPDLRAAAYRVAGRAYHDLKPTPNLARAVALYEQYLQLQPRDALILNNVAYLLAAELSPADPARAKSYSQRAYDVVKDWKPGEARARVLDTHGWVLVLNDEVSAGLRVLEAALEEHSFVDVHYHLGEAHLREKRGDEAREQLFQALAMIEKAKAAKQPVEPHIEERVRESLKRTESLNAAAAGAQ